MALWQSQTAVTHQGTFSLRTTQDEVESAVTRIYAGAADDLVLTVSITDWGASGAAPHRLAILANGDPVNDGSLEIALPRPDRCRTWRLSNVDTLDLSLEHPHAYFEGVFEITVLV